MILFVEMAALRNVLMHFFLGAIWGVLRTVLATLIADIHHSERAGREPANDLAGELVSASLESIREEVHELTR